MTELFYTIFFLAIFLLLAGGAVYLFRNRHRGGIRRSAPPRRVGEQTFQRSVEAPERSSRQEWESGREASESDLVDDFGQDIRPTSSLPIEGPPELIRAVELQRAYWTYHEEERARLEERGLEELSWRERLRLHHLTCLGRLACLQGIEDDSVRAVATEKCRAISLLLISEASPYRPRPALVRQGYAAHPEDEREPDLEGELLNPSLTHLGCLEIYRLDAANQPTRIDFVSFDELSGIRFGLTKSIRAAILFYEDGRTEVVFVPLLYGLTWAIGNEYDRAGRMTRFVDHLVDEEGDFLGLKASGLGVGQQDLRVHGPDGAHLFGLGSVAEISFPLDMSDPRFDERARARGIDPDEVRRRML